VTTVAENLARVRNQITTFAARYGRAADDVRLVAVSKTKSAALVREALTAGQRDFGENQLQDALTKIDALADPAPCWHFIGPVQSNKTRPVAERFSWVHSIDRLKIARRLSAQRPDALPALNICVQVNISGEESKSGVAPAELSALAREVATLPRLRLRGLMAVPAPCATLAGQRAPFARLRGLLETLNAEGFDLDTLSMGMTDDLEAAIAEGATMVRIGTAIFGARPTASP